MLIKVAFLKDKATSLLRLGLIPIKEHRSVLILRVYPQRKQL